MYVHSLAKLNEDVNEHAAMTRRSKKICPRLGLLVLARLPCDGLYEAFIFSVNKLHYGYFVVILFSRMMIILICILKILYCLISVAVYQIKLS